MQQRSTGDIRARVLAAIDPAEVTRLLARLVQFASVNPPGEEKDIAEHLADYMGEGGLAVEMQESLPGRPSTIGTLRGDGSGPTLAFNGHIDVVPATEGWSISPFKAEIRRGRLYGRGSADMKGGVAAMVAAALAVKKAEAPLRGTLQMLAASDEEVSEAGTRVAMERGLAADFAIVPEPSSLQAVIAHNGVIHFLITTRGVTAHASTPQLGLNAIEKMCEVVKVLDSYKPHLRLRRHPLVGTATMNVGTIQGGVATNVVPDWCQITVDRRVVPGERTSEARQELESILNAAATKDPELRIQVDTRMEIPPMEIGEDEAVVKALRRAGQEVLGRPIPIGSWPATSDAGYMVNEGHIPTVIFGPGDINLAHKPDEWVDIEEVVQATRIFALTILDLLG